MSLLALSSIRLDGGTQPRASIDRCVIDDYGREMRSGVEFPAVVVFYDGTDYWLADGFHRAGAVEWVGEKEIECDIRQGTREDAQWYSFGANQHHGLRRTNEDKQRAVKAALAHQQSQGLSDSAIARHVGVDQKTVTNWRHLLEASKEIPKMPARTVSRAGKSYRQNTEAIGKSKSFGIDQPVKLSERNAALRVASVESPSASSRARVAPQTEQDARLILHFAREVLARPSTPEAIAAFYRNGDQGSIDTLAEAAELLCGILLKTGRQLCETA